MKLLDILLEIGEANVKPYKYTIDFEEDGEAQYLFTTDSKLEYQVNIADPYTKISRIIIAFKEIKGEYEDITNKGEHSRIMATVIACVKDYLAKNPKIKELSFTPSKSHDADDRRSKLYNAYIQKQIPGSKIFPYSDGRIIVELPKKR
jgi:hypothetical protein